MNSTSVQLALLHQKPRTILENKVEKKKHSQRCQMFDALCWQERMIYLKQNSQEPFLTMEYGEPGGHGTHSWDICRDILAIGSNPEDGKNTFHVITNTEKDSKYEFRSKGDEPQI